MLSLRQGDIVFAYFPFEEDKARRKKRPCLVLAVEHGKSRFLAAKITTTQLLQSWSVYLHAGTLDLASGSLRSESWINLNRREWLSFSDYIFTIGSINPDILNTVIRKITQHN